MDRRLFISGIASGALVEHLSASADERQAMPGSFEALLSRIQADSEMVEAGWKYREPSVSRGVGHGEPSKRKLSQAAIDLIVSCEIASPAVYERKYRRPIWPKGASGVTIGVGYDLRYANARYINRDWPMLSTADRAALLKVATLSGQAAKAALPQVHDVDIPWPAANSQFLAFLPYPTKQTEGAFPNCNALSDDSFGALVSLIYNRGPAIVRNSKSRLEMYEIKQLMAAKKFKSVPDRIRSMKRLWTTPDSRGLVLRREAEAALFERGLHA
ncbi:hypothetical protein [Burkholderia pyrrocinia]|uniref:hypothetical protein n=1 Tax=Burkholderia pyrrocinia TaxID=60550 RepID=UPI000A630EFE|nr:hypothetical protein [Burkholderia pyrrocinia]